MNRLGGLNVAQAIAKFGRLVARHIGEVRELVDDVPGVVAAPAVVLADADDFRERAAEIAWSELKTFAFKRDGSVAKETDEPLRSRILEYFRFVGRGDVTDPSKTPWSAAFISFVMKEAGADRDQFPFSAGHHKFIRKALQNRLDGKTDASVVYFDRDEIAPRVGDLIGFSRTSKVKTRADIEKLLPDGKFPAHTDLVVAVKPGLIRKMGGNVTDAIHLGELKTNADDGKLKPSNKLKHFFVLRVNI